MIANTSLFTVIALIQHTVQEKFENTKQNKMTNNEIQDTTLKTKRTTHRANGDLSCSGRINSFCLTSGIHRVTNQVIRHE